MNRKPAAVLGMVALVAIAPVARAAPNLSDPCYGPTRPLTQELRKAFVDEIGPLAKKAEADHGIPAPILAAMSVNESGYGTTQLAIGKGAHVRRRARYHC